MPLYSFEGKAPRVHPSAFIAPTTTLIGEVIVEEGASVWYGAVAGFAGHGGRHVVKTNPGAYADLARRHAAGVAVVAPKRDP